MAQIPTKRLKEILKHFEGQEIIVVGYIMLDHFIKGSVIRISPEAPVPVVDVKNEFYVAGGAGNVAVDVGGLLDDDVHADRFAVKLGTQIMPRNLEHRIHHNQRQRTYKNIDRTFRLLADFLVKQRRRTSVHIFLHFGLRRLPANC